MDEPLKDGEDTFRDHIATVNEKGKRIWVYPKKPGGKFYNYRKWVSYFLLFLLFASPHIKYHGEQLFLFNVVERKFVIFFKVFWPQDLYIFAIAIVLGVVFVIFFTIIYGRIFCGWVCPQTIFMEMLFRRVEYWIEGDWTHQKKLSAQPWNTEKILKRGGKHVAFWLISFIIANTFLSYIIGSDELWRIATDPIGEHWGGFIAIIIFTYVFYGVFAWLREQVCTTICPYGRLQGVLLDENSMVVAYDHKRGENRGKFKKGEDRSQTSKGDCIDCKQCVHVCPTGIDIRNGTQLECINCTACIDACDHIMEGVGMEKGLIRFVSEKGITERKGFEWTRRVKAYTFLLFLLMVLLGVLLVTRKDVETTILRQRGSTFQITDDKQISNIFEINMTNKTRHDFNIRLTTDCKDCSIKTVVKKMKLDKEKRMKERFIMKMPVSNISGGKRMIKVQIWGNGKLLEETEVKFIGPLL
ncbi:MAG: cytochrome c oxidase accessory protein CcoG [Bacteroidetes bacterium]|nr:MAG: cytochrome c oxidase accessory protein CcoG [Bacteroidota bacterium]